MNVVLLIAHGLVAVALIGALSHQLVALWWPAGVPARSFFARYRGRSARGFTLAIVVLYLATFVLGSLLYPSYRVGVRVVFEDLLLMAPTGAFEIKEHLAALGLGLLPAYWYYWRQPTERFTWTRRVHTTFLATVVWYAFLVGHVLNNLRGLDA